MINTNENNHKLYNIQTYVREEDKVNRKLQKNVMLFLNLD